MARKPAERPAVPGLSGSGLQLRTAVVEEFDLAEHELAILQQACRTRSRSTRYRPRLIVTGCSMSRRRVYGSTPEWWNFGSSGWR
jgi:hypothetical protein